MSDKVYNLPDLAPAPTSDLQHLVRRLIEYADWTTVPPILDELKELGRDNDAIELKKQIVRLVYIPKSEPHILYWPHDTTSILNNLVELFWWDLFSLDVTLAIAEEKSSRNPAATLVGINVSAGSAGSILVSSGIGSNVQWNAIASEDIPAGSLVTSNTDGTVRLATPASTLQQAVDELEETLNDITEWESDE